MKKHTIINLILAVLYIPLSFFCWLMGMATEGLMRDPAPLMTVAIYFLAWGGMLTGAATHPCLIVSQYFYSKKNNPAAGRFFRFLPPVAVIVLWLVAFGLEALDGIL